MMRETRSAHNYEKAMSPSCDDWKDEKGHFDLLEEGGSLDSQRNDCVLVTSTLWYLHIISNCILYSSADAVCAGSYGDILSARLSAACLISINQSA